MAFLTMAVYETVRYILLKKIKNAYPAKCNMFFVHTSGHHTIMVTQLYQTRITKLILTRNAAYNILVRHHWQRWRCYFGANLCGRCVLDSVDCKFALAHAEEFGHTQGFAKYLNRII